MCSDPSELLLVLEAKLGGLFFMQGHAPLIGILHSVLSLKAKGALYKVICGLRVMAGGELTQNKFQQQGTQCLSKPLL